MVPDSIGNASIQSFYAPYFRECNKCDGEKNCLIDALEHKDNLQNSVPPEVKCGDCNEELEFDALEESYFSFFSKSK